ncbi:MAG: glycosyltransferase, partial [Rhodothermales bacterium]|nr:glycosyltransferase [Rhodothermales bacterium]
MTDSRSGSSSHLLLLAYYFPPMGMSGVQRVSKFVKYLPDNGWDVTVVTPTAAGYFAYDASLLSDVDVPDVQTIRTRSIDPTRFFRPGKVVSLPGEARRRWASRLTGLLFVPDNKLGWYPFARRAAQTAHRLRPFDAVLSSAPPYTSHLVARAVARRLKRPLVLDFRDDWVGNPRHDYPTAAHRRVHRIMERKAVESSSACITINRVIADSIRNRARSSGETPRFAVIPQGFDPADFVGPVQVATTSDDRMRFLYSGVFYDAQTPDPFLRGLRLAIDRRPELTESLAADFIGLVPSDFEHRTRALELDRIVRYHGYATHDSAVQWMRRADILWLTIGRREGSEGISTGKLYEYVGTRKPILGLVPEGVARDDIIAYGAGVIADPESAEDVASA